MRRSLFVIIFVCIVAPCLTSGQVQPATAQASALAAALVSSSDPRIQIIGRYDDRDPAHLHIAYPGVTVRFRFIGSSATLHFSSDSDAVYLATVLDGGDPEVHRLPKGASDITIQADLAAAPHTLEIVKRTETWEGVLTFSGISLSSQGALLEPPPLPRRKLMFVGDSVTCGAGVDEKPGCTEGNALPSNAYDSYGMLLGRRMDAQAQLVCYGGRGVLRDYRGFTDILNAPQFIDLSIPSDDPAQRVTWSYPRYMPDAIVVSLGTNDFNLQKTKPLDRDQFVSTYSGIVRTLRTHYPQADIFLTEGAIVTDPLLRSMVQQVARDSNDPHVRWVASQHYSGLDCNAHPTRTGHRHIADDLEPVLRDSLGW